MEELLKQRTILITELVNISVDSAKEGIRFGNLRTEIDKIDELILQLNDIQINPQ